MMQKLLVILLFLLHSSAQANPYTLLGACEFVLDSQRIQEEGKFAIEELQGHYYAELPEDAFTPYYPVICEDDVLNITLYHPSRRDLMAAVQLINARTGGFRVVNGKITLPELNAVDVRGLTLPQARQEIKARFNEQIKDIEIYLSFKAKESNKIIITGLVSPPPIAADGQLRLYEVLTKAFIPPTANLFASYVLRDNLPLKLDLSRLLKMGDMNQNIVMKGGDKIFIASPTDHVAMVLGDVHAPKRIPLLSGSISLKEALALARGIRFTGNKNHIQVIRGNISCPRIYTFTWDFVVHEPNKNLLLIPGDVVFVSRKAITEWALFMRELEGTIRLIPAVELINQISK